MLFPMKEERERVEAEEKTRNWSTRDWISSESNPRTGPAPRFANDVPEFPTLEVREWLQQADTDKAWNFQLLF